VGKLEWAAAGYPVKERISAIARDSRGDADHMVALYATIDPYSLAASVYQDAAVFANSFTAGE
jgi:hypothetical protein